MIGNTKIQVSVKPQRFSTYCHTSHPGFALVATISVMILLVMIALATLSLSSLVIRQETAQNHQKIAEQNARMAAMLALNDLQMKLGPDQRVSATASILGDTVNPYKKNWTLTWDTTSWDPQNPITTRDNAYLGAIVSGSGEDAATNINTALGLLSANVATTDDQWINLVGEGTVNNANDYVYAEKVNVRKADGTDAGSYAYWVGDEGVKARIDITPPDTSPLSTWAYVGKMASAPGNGIHKITGLENYTTYLPNGSGVPDLEKFISHRTLDHGELAINAIKNNYHNITTHHTGLLVDNRWGGIRRDLSTAFEISPEIFGEIEEFNNSEESNQTEEYSSFTPSDVTTNPLYYHNGTDPELGYLYEVPVDSVNRYRGPTWDLLRNHYRIYKKERNALNFRGLPTPSNGALAAHGVVPFSYTGNPSSTIGSSYGAIYIGPNVGGPSSFQCPFVSPHGEAGGHDPRNGNMMQPTVQKITPELIRVVIVYGLSRIGNKYYFRSIPYFTFHNPYNYPLEFHSLSVDVRGLEGSISFNVDYTNSSNGTANKEIQFQVRNGQSVRRCDSYRLQAPTNGLYRLEPGEIRLMSMQPDTEIVASNADSIRFTEFRYNEGNGALTELSRFDGQGRDISGTLNVLDVQPNSQISIKMRTQPIGTLGSFFVRLYHPEQATGGAYDMDNTSYFAGGVTVNDTESLSLIKNMRMFTRTRLYNSPDEIRTFNENQVPHPSDGHLTLFAMDMRMKTFQDDVAVLSDFNYRSMGLCSRDYDGGDDLAPNWSFEVSPIGDYSQLQLTDDPNATAYWGTSHEAGSGQSNIILFDLPRSPSVSLASLQHADTSILNFHPMHSIAHSRVQVGQEDLTQIYNRLNRVRGATIPKRQIDTSWASNEALWDRYFFSGINWGSSTGQPYSTQRSAIEAIANGQSNEVFANSRIKLLKPVSSDDINDLINRDAYAKIGEFLGTMGAFNVNSTSVEAWKAVLASLSGHSISYLVGVSDVQRNLGQDISPISRFSTPAGDENDDYMGFRALTDSELELLAEAIVEQVKLRGPFMGLSDFVNRRLLADNTGESGAIQAAIDESNINASVSIGTANKASLRQSAEDANNGMARHLSQGDVLTPLAPIMATRSDTFVIRAYGDSKDTDGTIKATAWCEIVVQRIPDWLEPTTEAATRQNPNYPTQNSTAHPILRKWETNPNLPDACQKFGRKLEIKSFRWLSASEV